LEGIIVTRLTRVAPVTRRRKARKAARPTHAAPAARAKDAGFSSLGVFIGAAALAIAFLVTLEAQRAFTIQQGVEDQLSRAANIAISQNMSDDSRYDYIRALNAPAAREAFYKYLYDNMSLNSSLEAFTPEGRRLYRLEITSLGISSEPPKIAVSAYVAFEPTFLGSLAPITIRLPVRALAVNHDLHNLRK
jgi:hypothetical protein